MSTEQMTAAIEAAAARIPGEPDREPDAIHIVEQRGGGNVLALGAEQVEFIRMVTMDGVLHAEVWHYDPERIKPTYVIKTFREIYSIPAVSKMRYGGASVAEDSERNQYEIVHILSLMDEAWCHRTQDFEPESWGGILSQAQQASLVESDLCSECMIEAEQNEQDQA